MRNEECAEGCRDRSSSSDEKMRETRCVVAEYDSISDSGTPPLVLRGDAKRRWPRMYRERALTWVYGAERGIAESEWLVDGVRADVERIGERVSSLIRQRSEPRIGEIEITILGMGPFRCDNEV